MRFELLQDATVERGTEMLQKATTERDGNPKSPCCPCQQECSHYQVSAGSPGVHAVWLCSYVWLCVTHPRNSLCFKGLQELVEVMCLCCGWSVSAVQQCYVVAQHACTAYSTEHPTPSLNSSVFKDHTNHVPYCRWTAGGAGLLLP